jgi:U3 small nucleolar RNA-associated protein 25
MLYTGRAHFFLRHKIKGIRHLIFFGLPEHPEFYADLVNVINEGLEKVDGDLNTDSTTSSLALFTKYEPHALERIVGTKQSNRMVKGDKSSFLFVS